jgi:uncharacterized repeat protein (TIGR03803 family)
MKNATEGRPTGLAARAALTLAVLAIAPAAHAGAFTVFYPFTGASDGAFPGGAGVTPGGTVTFDSAGNMYGETAYGALRCREAPEGCGTLFKIDPTGKETTLVTFKGPNGAIGVGNVTIVGNRLFAPASTSAGPEGETPGLVFSVKTDGTGYKVLHTFNGTDGFSPQDSLRIAPSGSVLYGITWSGGPSFQANGGFGVLYQIASDGSYTVLHNFTDGADGGSPTRILVSKDGTIYGATGRGQCPHSEDTTCGVIYSYYAGIFTTLYTFPDVMQFNGPGSNSLGGIGPDGTLYGSTASGGANGLGSLFKLQPKQNGGFEFVTIYSFTGEADGARPPSPPALTADGDLVGVSTYTGNIPGTLGTLYSFADDVFTVLYNFPGSSFGNPSLPEGTPTVDRTGTIWGTTYFGGIAGPCYDSSGVMISDDSCGEVYKYVE